MSRDVEVTGLWTAIRNLWAEGARTFELSLAQAAANRALSTAARGAQIGLAFTSVGIVVSVTGRLGPLRLPPRRYTLGVDARGGRAEVDLTEIFRIPLAGARIAAMLDAKIARLDGLTIRRRGALLTVGHPRLRCERATSDDRTLRIRVHVRRGSASARRVVPPPSPPQGSKRRRKSSANRS
ncbi:MAG TPA: hypothetical protein VMS64_03765 [Candidatus Methylomirabilis sp.]|nr:hypothetical protein [Candidatus Methylomirabilis sp.]